MRAGPTWPRSLALGAGVMACVLFSLAPAGVAEPGDLVRSVPKADTAKAERKTGADEGGKRLGSKKPGMTMEMFLDRLMLAESGGRDTARNSRSTAVGPYQFIEATFLDVARRHFGKDVDHLNDAKLLALRTDRKFSRQAAEAYTRDNAAHLASSGVTPTFPHLRLAFLLGPGGAVQVLRAKPAVRVSALLPRRVIRANPFMARMTVLDLIARAARDISVSAATKAGVTPDGRVAGKRGAPKPAIRVRCDLALASCRRWLALAKRRAAHRKRRTARR